MSSAAHDEYGYPSDLDSDEGSIIWDDDDASGFIDTADTRSLASTFSRMRFRRYNRAEEEDEDEDEEDTTPATPGMCVVCHRRPAFNKNGKTYPTCGLTCASKLQQNPALATPPRRATVDGSTRRTPAGRRTTTTTATTASGSGTTTPPPPPRPSCVVCKRRPSYEDRPTCGFKCAEELIKNIQAKGHQDPTQCDYCHRKPKNGTYPQCGQTCMDMAKVACLLCRSRPVNKRYHLCGAFCRKISVKATPLLLEAPSGHKTFEMVTNKFKKSWRSGSVPCPEIKRVFKIIENDEFLRPYDAYRQRVKNEHFRYHGTKRECNLGKSGTNQTKVCDSKSCSICNILKTSFKVSLALTSGAFGPGVYSSSASNKAFSYCGTGGALLLTKVVLGNVRQVSGWNEVMSCPPGFDSVNFERQNGDLNETIVYTDDAIRPVFLITF